MQCAHALQSAPLQEYDVQLRITKPIVTHKRAVKSSAETVWMEGYHYHIMFVHVVIHATCCVRGALATVSVPVQLAHLIAQFYSDTLLTVYHNTPCFCGRAATEQSVNGRVL
jgi:hypothetical protein